MKSIQEMTNEVKNHLTYLRNARYAMERDIEGESPVLSENELFLLGVIDVKEREIEMIKELSELLQLTKEIEVTHRLKEERS